MLSLNQLMILTQNERRRWKNSYDIDFFKAKQGEGDSGPELTFAAVITGGKEPRKPVVQMFSEEIRPEAPCKVSCNCPYFQIKLAAPLYASGTTDIQVRRSDIPEKYRGIQKPGLCPHLYRLVQTILSGNNAELSRLQRNSRNESVSDRLRRLL